MKLKREVIHIKGATHKNPIPTAVKIKNLVYSSALKGTHPETGEIPENVEEEVENIFNYIREIVKKAGGSTDDIAKVSVSLVDRELKKVVNKEWLKMFPNDNNRPVRHSTVRNLNVGLSVQIEFIAVL